MTENTSDKFITTEVVPLCQIEGRKYFISYQCRADEDTNIFNVLETMEFKLVVHIQEGGDSQPEIIFESPEWVAIEMNTREHNGFEYKVGSLDPYALTQDVGYLSMKLSNCLEDLFPESEDGEPSEEAGEMAQELIDNMIGESTFDEVMEKAIVQYIKTYC
jgi:hypothetical protein